MGHSSDDRKAAFILSGFAVTEGSWLFLNLFSNSRGFFRFTGFVDGHAEPIGWVLSIAVFIGFVTFAARLPSVRSNLFRFSRLKLLALAMAIAAGFCEEAIFRKLLMDTLAGHGLGVWIQLLASGFAFGAVHGIWGVFRGSLSAAIGATVVTGVLGFTLALVYIASHRLLAPCVVSHLLINAFAEPGLVLAAVRGEMGGGRRRADESTRNRQ